MFLLTRVYHERSCALYIKLSIKLSQLLLTMMDIEKLDKTKRIVRDGQEDEPAEVTANMELEQQQLKQVVQKLLQPCVLNLRTSLQEKKYTMKYYKYLHCALMPLSCRFKREVWEPISKQLSHIALFWYITLATYYCNCNCNCNI